MQVGVELNSGDMASFQHINKIDFVWWQVKVIKKKVTHLKQCRLHDTFDPLGGGLKITAVYEMSGTTDVLYIEAG